VSGPATVRAGRPEDLDAVAAIYAPEVLHGVATFEREPPDRDEWLRRFEAVQAAGLPFLVAERDGTLLGYAYCSPWKPRAAYAATVEDSVYVAPEAHGQGVGTALLGALLEAAAAAGKREVIAVIATGEDSASTALHRRLGFVEAGRLRAVGHKHGRYLDTILMQRSLVG